MPTLPAGGSAYGTIPAATVAGGTRSVLQTGIAGTVTTPVAGITTTNFAGADLRKSRNQKHRLNRTIQTTATAVVVSGTVAQCTDAMQTVRAADRVPATLVNGKRTGRIRRIAKGAVATFSGLVGGTGYTSAAYTDVPLVRTAGESGGILGGVAANITVAGGIVTVCTLVAARNGEGYEVGQTLTAAGGYLGAGTGFTINVASIADA